MSRQDIYHCNGGGGKFDYLYFHLGNMKNIAALKVGQRVESTSIYPTNLMEMIKEKNFRAKEFFDRASNSALESWKVRSRTYLIDHSTTTLILL